MENLRIQLIPCQHGTDQQPFHIAFTTDWNGNYPTGKFTLPYSPNDIAEIYWMLQLRMSRPKRWHCLNLSKNGYTDERRAILERCGFIRKDKTNFLIEDPIRHIGEALYRGLFEDNPSVKNLFQKFLDNPARERQIVFVFDLSYTQDAKSKHTVQTLMGLPWEMLRDPEAMAPLCIAQNVIIVRCCQRIINNTHRPLGWIRTTPPEKVPILELVPEHGSDDLTYLEGSKQANPQHACDNQHPTWCRVQRYDKGVSRESLRRDIQDHKPHILHYFGHGTFTAQGFAFLIDDPSRYEVPSFWRDLHDHNIRLLVSFACFSGAIDTSEKPPSIEHLPSIPTLLSDALPAMLLMQTTMPIQAGGVAGAVFYRQLARGASIVQAMQKVRKTLFDLPDTTVTGNAWWIPTLYLRYPEEQLSFVKVRGCHDPPQAVSYSGFMGHIEKEAEKETGEDRKRQIRLIAKILLAFGVPLKDDDVYHIARVSRPDFQGEDIKGVIHRLEPYICWDCNSETNFLLSEVLHTEWHTEYEKVYEFEVTKWIQTWQEKGHDIQKYPDALLHVLVHPTHRQYIDPLLQSISPYSFTPWWQKHRPYKQWRELSQRYTRSGLHGEFCQLIAYRLKCKRHSNLDRAVLEYLHDSVNLRDPKRLAQEIIVEYRIYLGWLMLVENSAKLREYLPAESESIAVDQQHEWQIVQLAMDLKDSQERAQSDQVTDDLVQHLAALESSTKRGFILRFLLVPVLRHSPDKLQIVIRVISASFQPEEQLHLGIALALTYRGTTIKAEQELLQQARNWLREQRQTQAPTRRMLLLFTALLPTLDANERQDIAAFLMPILAQQHDPSDSTSLNDTNFSQVEWLVYEIVLRQCAGLEDSFAWSNNISKPYAEPVQRFARETVAMCVQGIEQALLDTNITNEWETLRTSLSQSTPGYELHALAAMLRSLHLLGISVQLPDAIQQGLQQVSDLLTRAVAGDRCVIATLAPWFKRREYLQSAMSNIVVQTRDNPMNAWFLTMLAEEPDFELRKLWLAVLDEQVNEMSRLEVEEYEQADEMSHERENRLRCNEVISQKNFDQHREQEEEEGLRECTEDEFQKWCETAKKDIEEIFGLKPGRE